MLKLMNRCRVGVLIPRLLPWGLFKTGAQPCGWRARLFGWTLYFQFSFWTSNPSIVIIWLLGIGMVTHLFS